MKIFENSLAKERKSMQAPAELAAIRQQIDLIDDQLVPLLARRVALALEASRHKRTAQDVRGCDRAQQVLDAVAARAGAVGGDADTIVAIYRHIIEMLTHLQLREKGLIAS